jgi:pilus assembly protein CpaF
MKATIAWGPLKKLIDNKDVHEIIIDRCDDSLFATRKGVQKGPKFKQTDLMKLAQQILKHSVDPKALSAEVLLPNNILVGVVMPPLAPEGPFLRIWKMPKDNISLNQMVEWEVMSKAQAQYISQAVKNNESIIIAGNAGSGKTTLFNTVLDCLPENYHLVTIEQYRELIINRPHTARLVAPRNEAQELVQLVQVASRSRGDCLALSTAHGVEILPFIELLRDGHQGMMSLSGENVFDALKRLEYKISAHAPWMTLDDVRFSITKAFSHILFQSREADGKRKLTHLSRLVFSDGEIKVETVKVN